IHLLPRIGLVCYAYAWALEQVEGVKATPRIPGARLGVGVALLDLRRKGPRLEARLGMGALLARLVIHAYAWLGNDRGHA
ncbi:hypothetical protein PIB30_081222, partial [Stylosanthes scabra]|nr:hypothetical protein [Stylosanthes scabra]